jgi:hypothetical protein
MRAHHAPRLGSAAASADVLIADAAITDEALADTAIPDRVIAHAVIAHAVAADAPSAFRHYCIADILTTDAVVAGEAAAIP